MSIKILCITGLLACLLFVLLLIFLEKHINSSSKQYTISPNLHWPSLPVGLLFLNIRWEVRHNKMIICLRIKNRRGLNQTLLIILQAVLSLIDSLRHRSSLYYFCCLVCIFRPNGFREKSGKANRHCNKVIDYS